MAMMESPNYGLLKDIPRPQPKSLADYAKLKIENGELAETQRLNDSKLAQEAVDLETSKINQGYLPEQLDEKHAMAVAELNAKKIAAQKEQQAIQMAKVKQTNDIASSVIHAAPEQKPLAYKNALMQLKESGVDISNLPQSYDDPAAPVLVEQAWVNTGKALEEYDAKTKRLGEENKSPRVQAEVKRTEMMYGADLKESEAINAAASAAIQNKNNLKNFEAAAEQMSLGTSPLIGQFQAIAGFPEAQKARKFQEALALGILGTVHFGRVTNKEMDIVRASIPNIDTSAAARQDIVKKLDAFQDRDIEKQKFWQTVSSRGVYDPEVKNRLWNKFVEENRIIDDKGNLDPKNISNWQDYASDKAIQDTLNGKEFTKSTKSMYTVDGDSIVTASGRKISKEELQKIAAGK